MRKIKFRAWDGIRMTTSGIMFNCSTGKLETPEGARMKVMQFTGLRDRNGKEIYEGDIITGWTSAKEVVVFDNDNARFKPTWLQLWNNEYRDVKMEVIGNIYENPELING